MKTKIEVGQKYNRLTVLEKLGYDKHNNRMYRCLCDCGNEIVLRGTAFTSGNTKSCGCLSKEVKKAKRLPNNQGVINHAYCSQCLYGRNIETQIGWNYCPNCGAKMDLEG